MVYICKPKKQNVSILNHNTVTDYRELWILTINLQADCKAASSKICQLVLGKEDYQLGHTKVFLKDAHDTLLEQERERVLAKSILVLQRSVRTWVCRKR
jgi:myosin heavy subunit